MSHTFLTYFVPWDRDNFKESYVPTIYDQYTEQYINLTKKSHEKLSNDFGIDYVFIDDLDYCLSLFDKYRLPRLGTNDLFNIKFLLLEEYFNKYDTITYIDFDVVAINSPNEQQVQNLKSQTCHMWYIEPIPDGLVYQNTQRLCNEFNIQPHRPIFQNNNGVYTLSKQAWKNLDYIETVKEIYRTTDLDFAETLCDESLFNFITLYKNVYVDQLDYCFNTMARTQQEYDKLPKDEFAMIHFSKDTGKEVLNNLLFDPTSILY